MQAAEEWAQCSLREDALSWEQDSSAGREAEKGAGALPTRERPSRKGKQLLGQNLPSENKYSC